MKLHPANMFSTEPMSGGSINGWTFIPSEFVITIYIIICITLAVTTVSHINKGLPIKFALRKACLTAFFCSGLVYMIYSEGTWYRWFVADLKIYRGHTTDEKVGIFNGSFYQILTAAKQSITDNDYTIYASDSYINLISQYYLLPKRHRIGSRHTLVLNNKDTLDENDYFYDMSAGTIRQGSKAIENADVIYSYDGMNFIMRRR
jgi:hypothetical protein